MARCASAAAGRTSWRRAPFLWRPNIDTSDRQAALSILRGTRCACIHATGWPAIRFAADLVVEGVEAIAGFCLRFRVQRHLQFAKEVFSKDGLFDELKKALAERVLNAELDDHLDGEAVAGKANHRNGYSKKTVLTETSKIDIKVPRDREGTFDPKLIQRYQRRFPGFDEKIVSMYARGMTVREIQGHLLDLYGLEVSPDLVSTITDAVLETVAEWQNRPLEAMYPLIFFDALRVKIRDEGLVRNKAVYVALGVTPPRVGAARRPKAAM